MGFFKICSYILNGNLHVSFSWYYLSKASGRFINVPDDEVVWSCVLCLYRVKRHSVIKHVFAKHLSLDEWSYQCPLCQYSHYAYLTSGMKYISQWQPQIQISKGSRRDTSPEQGCFLFRQWTIKESRHTGRVRRGLPLFKWCLALHPLSLPSRSEILPCLMPKSSQTSQAVSSTVSALVSSVVTVTTSTSSSVLAFPLVSKSTVPSLNPSEMYISNRVLIWEDSSEFDLENVPSKTTRDIGVNTYFA